MRKHPGHGLMMTSYNMDDANFVADKAATTHKKIKILNQRVLNNRGKAKQELKDAIDDEKQQWWEEVRHLMVKS